MLLQRFAGITSERIESEPVFQSFMNIQCAIAVRTTFDTRGIAQPEHDALDMRIIFQDPRRSNGMRFPMTHQRIDQ